MEVVGHAIVEVQVRQPKTLNLPVDAFVTRVVERRILDVHAKGKWLVLRLKGALRLLINLGMGGDLLHFDAGSALPASYQFKLGFDDGSGITIRFSWFGYVHLVDEARAKDHTMTGALALTLLDAGFTPGHFAALMKGRRGRVKNLLVNQRRIAGIGNVYVQDILFHAKIHPSRRIATLTDAERTRLYAAIQKIRTGSTASYICPTCQPR
jgi:formamidopyrimidine-DNA glycosylase